MILALLLSVSFADGLALKKQEKFAEAAGVFASLVKQDPRDEAALSQLATLLGWLGRYDESIAAWRRALEVEPNDPDAAIGLARVHYWKGELQPARAVLATLLSKSPANLDALLLCGDISTAAHDAAGAHDCYLGAKALDPAARGRSQAGRQAAAPSSVWPPSHRRSSP